MPQSGIPLYYLCAIIYFRNIHMGKDFVHLHVHTHYSINDGIARVKDIVEKAVKDGMRGVAITDHGNMFGIMEFNHVVSRINEERRKRGVEPFKPIFGCEMYVARNGNMKLKNDREDFGGYHLVVLAKNYQGYRNLLQLVSHSWVEGYYVRPRTDRSDLERYHEGLIVLSGCIGGEVPTKILKGDIDGAREAIEWHKSLWGDDYYFELERHMVTNSKINANRETFDLQQHVNNVLIELAKEYCIKLVCTNDVHFVNKEHAEAHDRMLCISTGKELDDTYRMQYTKQEWFKTRKEMKAIFRDIPEALSNTIDIFNKVEFYSIEHTPTIPLFPISKDFASEHDYLEELTINGARKKFGEKLPSEVEERLHFELAVIKTKGFSRYFLIIQDLINVITKEYCVIVGPGRASLAGSLVLYCLGITKIDPLQHGLLFERFIRLNRDTLPGVCIDLDSEGRLLAKKYLEDKYGKDCCAHIITFTKLSPQKALKYVAKLENVSQTVVNALWDGTDPHFKSIAFNCNYTPAFKKAEKSKNPVMRNLIMYSKMLEGTICGTGIHPSGFVISQEPISAWAPVSTSDDPNEECNVLHCTQYEDDYVESSGVVRMDLCGLRTLSEIKSTLFNIKQSHGIEINLDNIPLDDRKTLKLFQNGHTVGVFGFESGDIKAYLSYLKPTKFDDLAALYALYRPGPWDYIPQLIRRKHGEEPITYDIPIMKKYLKETYGLIIYQEQIMLLSRQLADFSQEESYKLQDAMGKMKKGIIDEMKQLFIDRGKKKGHNPVILNKIWTDWENMKWYIFLKAHAVSYTMIAYQSAYLKANYPYEYMTALLKSRNNEKLEYERLLEECMRMKLYKIFKDNI